MSEVAKRVVCVRLAMSESLSRSRRPTAEGPWLHRAGVARRRAGSRRRVAFGRAARADDGPMDRTAGTSCGCLGGGTGSETLGADGGCPRPLRGLALGLVALSALVVAVPTEAQTNTAPTAMDGAVTLLENSEHSFTAAEFNFSDTDSGAALASVTVVETPALGALFISATSLFAQDGSEVSANTSVTKAAIDAGRFKFDPPDHAHGSPYTTFTFKVSDGTDESAATYTMTLNVTGVNDPPTGEPRITGTPRVGETLTASVSGIGDIDGLTNPGYTYQWLRVSGGNSENIAGAVASTYTLTGADVGHRVRVRVMFTDDDGTPETLTSDATGQVLSMPGALSFRALVGDGRVRLSWNSPSDLGGVAAATLTYQYRYAPGAAVPAETAWSPPERYPIQGSVILAGLANGTAYAFEVRAVNQVGAGPAATATATPQRAACPAPALGGRRQIWRAALTIGAAPEIADLQPGEVLFFGYDASAAGTLSDTGFRVGATRYSIGQLYVFNPRSSSVFPGDLRFSIVNRDLSPAHQAALRLHVCDTAYDFNTEYVFTPDNFYIENNQYPYLWRHGRGDPSGLYPNHLDWGLLVDRTVSLSLPANTPATGNPTVTGAVRVGQVLTAATGTIADADGLTLADAGEAGFGYTYQWVRVDEDGMSNPADIPGATGATYTVTGSDAGKKLKVRVSFTDDLNSEEARESDGTVKNTPPTASDGRVTALENQDYTFTAADFNYADSDGDPLASVTIKVRPESGALKLDNANVRVDATVTRAQLDAGSLTYTPPTDQTGTGVAFFYFAVSDGIAESTSVYRIDIDIAEDTVAPGRPRNLTAVPGNGAVALRWEAPLSPGSSAIVRYEVRHAAGDAVPPATAWESVGLTFTHPVTGLADGQRHTFEVRAVNSSTPSEGTAAQVQDTPSATLTPSVSMEEVEVRVAEDAGTAGGDRLARPALRCGAHGSLGNR